MRSTSWERQSRLAVAQCSELWSNAAMRHKLFGFTRLQMALIAFEVVALAVAIITNWVPAYIAFVVGICVFALMLKPARLRQYGGDDPVGDSVEQKWKID